MPVPTKSRFMFTLIELRIIKRAVETAKAKKLFVVALLRYLSVADNKDKVRVLYGGKAVRDNKAGAAFHKLVHRFLYLYFRTGIDVGGGFVKYEHRRVRKHSAGDGDKLALTLGDVHALVGKDGVVAVGQMLYVAVYPCGFCGFFDLLHRSVFLAVNDIFKYRSVEEPRILKHHRVRTAKRFSRYIARFRSIHANFAAVYVVKTHKQIDYRCFARARRTYDGDGLSGFCRYGNVAENGLFGSVAEGHVLEIDLAFYIRECEGIFFVLGFGSFVKDVEYTLSRRKCGLELVKDIGKFADGTCELARILHEFRNAAERDEEQRACRNNAALRIHIEYAAEYHYKGDGKVVDKVYGRAERCTVKFRVVIRVHRIFIASGEAGGYFFLAVISLYRAAAGEHFLRIAVELAELAGARLKQRSDFFGAVTCEPYGYGHGYDKNEYHRLRYAPHKDKRADYGVDTRHNLDKVVGKGSVYRIYIVGDTADYIACCRCIKEAYGECGQLFEKLLSHSADYLLTYLYH